VGHTVPGHLTAEERERLRPTVDLAALEDFIRAAPAGFRRFFFLCCVGEMSDAEFEALGLPCRLPPAKLHRAVGGLLDSELSVLWQRVEPYASRDLQGA
jgi:hypothetical protein